MTPQRQMIVIAAVALAVMLGFVALGFLPKGGPAPSASPSPSASASTAAETGDEQQTDPEATASAAPNFHGHECSPDCEEMRSGYSYALDNNFKSINDCAGAQNSEQFAEGCRIYVNDQAGGSP